jgi:type I restriction enzyme, S subunit
MSFLQYPLYKRFEVEGFPEAPAHWKDNRIDAIADTQKNQMTPEEMSGREVFHYSIPVVQLIADGQVEDGDDIDSAKFEISLPQILISKLNPRKGTVCIAEPHNQLTVCSTEFVAIIPHSGCLRYFYYVAMSEEFRMRLEARVSSATKSHQRVLPSDILKNYWIFPSYTEQETIVSFLDCEILKIEKLIADQERLIELLKEKRQAVISHAVTKGLDSNTRLKNCEVEWIEKIPEHWNVYSLKRDLLFLTSGSRGWAEHYSDDGYLFIRIGNLTRDSIGLDLSDIQRVSVPEGVEGERTRVQPNDLLFSITAYLGSIAIVPNDLETAFVSQHIGLARLKNKYLLPKWVGYIVLSNVGKSYFDTQGYGGTKVQLSLTDVAELPVTVPPLHEQKYIIDCLEVELEKIDNLVSEVERTIILLSERRSALISAAVTGKIDVRNYSPKSTEAA